MKPLKLQPKVSLLLNSTDFSTTGNLNNQILFDRYLYSWKELIRKPYSLSDFLGENTISDFTEEEIYHLEKILFKAYIKKGESELVADNKYFESFTIFLPTEKEKIWKNFNKSFSHSYLLGNTISRSFYISYGLLKDYSNPGSHQYRISNFYLTDSTVDLSLNNFMNKGFWFKSFNDNFVAVLKSMISTFDRESDRVVTERKGAFTKNIIKVLLNKGFSELSFDIIKKDFEVYFEIIHGDTFDQFDQNLLDIALKRSFDNFLKNPKLILDEMLLKPMVNTPYSCANFNKINRDPQSDFFEAILSKKINNPYMYKRILEFENKENLLLDILRSQFALNYLGKIYFSASYLVKNRDNLKKKALNILRYKGETLPGVKFLDIFKKLYPDLVNYLKLNFV